MNAPPKSQSVDLDPPSAGWASTARPNPLWQLTLTRLRLFFREPGAIFWTFGFPLVLSIALGIAFRNRQPEPVHIAVESEELEARLRGEQIRLHVLDAGAARTALRTGKVELVVQPGPPIVYLFDPTRPESRLARALADAALHPRGAPATVDKALTEPGSRYIDFLIPGLIGMTIMSSGMWGIGYVVVEVRTRKLLKRLVATPMSKSQFLWSFVLMRTLFLFLELPILLGFGKLIFDVGVAGSLPLLVAVSCMGALAFAGLGLLVASRAQNTQTVSGLINLVMLPMFVASGVFFSTARFPDAVQPYLRVLPLTALNDALRAVMIDGSGVRAIATQLGILALIAAVSFAAALQIFRWR
ncbi:MAG TPA: ABC transporter permease [Myxococcales bacterium]